MLKKKTNLNIICYRLVNDDYYKLLNINDNKNSTNQNFNFLTFKVTSKIINLNILKMYFFLQLPSS